MQKPDSKCKNKTGFKRKYRDVFLVFAVLMITGVLLAISAFAQFDPQPGSSGVGDFSTPDILGRDGSNQQPKLTALESDKISPQESGSSIKWTAKAEDPENDPMSFMFRLRGPSTGDVWEPIDVWKPVSQWSPDNTWKWDTNSQDAGKYQISVSVRDETHAGPQFTQDEKIVDFLLTAPPAPPAPPEVQAQPIVEPLPIVTAPEQAYVPPNEKPVISELSADKASPQETGSIVTWKALANDPENDPILFRFFLNGLPTTDWQSSNQWAWTANEGEAQVEVQVRDGKHAEQDGFDDRKSATFIISPPNQKPAIINFSPDKLSPQETGSTITWTAEVMDSENDPLQFQFLMDGQVVQDWSDSPVWSWTAAAEQVAPHAIEAKVRDGKHNPEGDSSSSANFEIVLPPNTAPVMSSLTADKESPQVTGTVVVWTAVASDVENDPLQFQFLMDGQVVQDWSDSPVWSWTAAAEQVAPHAIEAKVRDGKHNAEGDSASSANFEIVLPPNTAPVMSSLTADKESPQVTGTAVIWTAVASDAENDPLQFQFSMDGQVVQDWSDSPVWSWTAAAEQVGQHAFEAKVRDGKHNAEGDSASSANFEIVLPPNTAPVMSSLTADKESPQVTGTAVIWTAVASDAENDPLQFQFSMDGQVVQDWSDSPVWSWTAAAEQVGTHAIEAKVRDGKHNAEGDSASSANFEIVLPPNTAPVMSSLTADKESPQVTGTVVIWTAVASDAENDPLQFQFSMDGQVVQDWSDSPVWSWTAAAEQVGQHAFEAKVRDGKHNAEGDSASSANFEIVLPPNTAPVMSSLTADKESPQVTGTAVIWTAVASDAENDPLQFQFSMDGQVVQDWSDSPVWSWTAVAEQVGQHAIEAKVRDGKHNAEGDSASSANFEIVLPPNTAPVMSSLTADKESPQVTGTAVIWTAVASDAENDPLQFQFSLDGQAVQDWSDSPVWSWTAAAEQVGQHALRPR